MKEFKARKKGEHVVLFTLEDKTEMMKVLAREPWSFDKHLVVLQRYDGITDVREMNFNQSTF